MPDSKKTPKTPAQPIAQPTEAPKKTRMKIDPTTIPTPGDQTPKLPTPRTKNPPAPKTAPENWKPNPEKQTGPKSLSTMERAIAPGTAAWERQPWETDQAYMAFQAYLALGISKRSIDAVAQILYPTQSAKSISKGLRAKDGSNLGNWSTKNLWKTRCSKWDEHLHAIARQAQVDEIKEMNRAQARRMLRMQEIGETKLEELAADTNRVPSFQDAMKLVTEGAKGERAARGVGDSIASGININGGTGGVNITMNSQYNLKSLTDAELDQLISLQQKITPVLQEVVSINDLD